MKKHLSTEDTENDRLEPENSILEYDSTEEDSSISMPIDEIETEYFEDEGLSGLPSALSLMLKELNTYRVLTPEEEGTYGTMLKGTPEERKEAIDKLVLHNLRYVITIAKRYKVDGMELEDLIQEGTIGLMRAANMYDVDKGYRFSTYATWWIRQSIGRAIADKGWMVRYPVHLQEKIRRMNQIAGQALKDGIELSDQELADRMGIGIKETKSLKSVNRKVVSLNTPIGTDIDSDELGDLIEDKNSMQPEEIVFQDEKRRIIEEILDSFPERERAIIRMRFGFDGPPMTLEEVGQEFGITRERVRQIEKKGLTRMKHPKYCRQLMDLL